MSKANPVALRQTTAAPSNPPQELVEKALNYQNCGDYTQAEALYRAVLKRWPQHPEALHHLGLVYHQTGRNDIALANVSRAAQLAPDNPCYQCNLGVIHAAGGNPDQALSCYRRALEINPDYGDAYNNLGNVYRQKGNFAEAIDSYRTALRLQPDDAVALYNLGIAYRMTGQIEKEILCYQRSLGINSSDAKVWLNLGNALQHQGEMERAIDCYQNALRCNPDMPAAHNNLGSIWLTMGQLTKARTCFEQARRFKPDYAEAWSNLGNVFQNQGNFREAQNCFTQALRIKPDYTAAHSNLVYAMHCRPDVDQQAIYQAACAWRGAHGIGRGGGNQYFDGFKIKGKIKVGYLSPDFRTHSVSYFFLPLLMQHDRHAFEIFCYSAVIQPDSMTGRIRALADQWRTVLYRSDPHVAEMIRADHIDILVDLAGHTAGNRLTVFTHQPAPIQITWLGYPGTTGLPEIDYRFTDALADPPGGSDTWHSEKLVRLPDGFLCYAPPDQAPTVGPLPCLRNGYITFGSFNNLPKITAEVIALWSGLLQCLPNARLLLKSRQLADKPTRDNLLERFAAHGIPADRILLAGRVKNMCEHLALYNRVDIGLDPFPYNGTTTTFEALWMGVPVITLGGDRHAARVGASILSRLGLIELVAGTKDRFLKIGTDLALDTPKLAHLRAHLRRRLTRSPLCDAARFTGTIESVYQRLVFERCGTKPDRGR